ncbi:MAG: HEPN domain-containing protein [Chloroflexi bacterium]|nr:HEPN domain-containing protein [Chloroflexota bacterium]MCY3697113.1 HEPN domain-containing protein [Chloroflexota bacterium]
MNGGEPEPQDPERWLGYAEEDLRAARMFHERGDFSPRHACWYAQQSAEKALKAVVLTVQPLARKTHNMADLLPSPAGSIVSTADLNHLTDLVETARYPDATPTPTEADARRAVDVAGTIYDFVAAEFERRGAIN